MFHAFVDAVSGSPWSYAVVVAVAFLDAFFPIVPSETTVITAGVVAAAGRGLRIELVIVAAAVGAFAGDNFTYALGRFAGHRVERRLFRGERGQRAVRWARRMLDEHGGALVLASRFIPGGRTATTFTAGFVRFPWKTRFVPFDGAGCLLWAAYSGLVGYFGGETFENEPWKGLLLAFAIAGAVALVIELVRRLRARRRGT